MNDPAFPLYAQDFIIGVMFMDDSDIGKYIKLLAVQWDKGKIPKKRLGFIVNIVWDTFSDELKEKFKSDEQFIWNQRLEDERVKRKKFKERQASNGKKGGRPPKIKTQKKPLENEDENEDENENEKTPKGGVGEKFNFKKSLLDLGVEEKIASDWLKARAKKHATNSETAFTAIANQINISSLTANECIKYAAENSWAGFKSEWIDEKIKSNNARSSKGAETAKTVESILTRIEETQV